MSATTPPPFDIRSAGRPPSPAQGADGDRPIMKRAQPRLGERWLQWHSLASHLSSAGSAGGSLGSCMRLSGRHIADCREGSRLGEVDCGTSSRLLAAANLLSSVCPNMLFRSSQHGAWRALCAEREKHWQTRSQCDWKL